MTTATVNHIPVIEYVKGYCEALEENFKQHSVDMLTRNLEEQRFPENNKYYQEQLDAIMDGSAKLYKFDYTVGKKYIKIFNLQWQDACDYYNRKEGYRQGSVTAFVDKETGQVYKPASWRAPAKHVRFDMRDQNQREYMYAHCDWAGGYLYIR